MHIHERDRRVVDREFRAQAGTHATKRGGVGRWVLDGQRAVGGADTGRRSHALVPCESNGLNALCVARKCQNAMRTCQHRFNLALDLTSWNANIGNVFLLDQTFTVDCSPLSFAHTPQGFRRRLIHRWRTRHEWRADAIGVALGAIIMEASCPPPAARIAASSHCFARACSSGVGALAHRCVRAYRTNSPLARRTLPDAS